MDNETLFRANGLSDHRDPNLSLLLPLLFRGGVSRSFDSQNIKRRILPSSSNV